MLDFTEYTSIGRQDTLNKFEFPWEYLTRVLNMTAFPDPSLLTAKLWQASVQFGDTLVANFIKLGAVKAGIIIA